MLSLSNLGRGFEMSITVKPRQYRFSYRLYVTEVGNRNAIQLSVVLADGEPCSLEDVEKSMKDAVERAIDGVKA